jgi:hypothetical protein
MFLIAAATGCAAGRAAARPPDPHVSAGARGVPAIAGSSRDAEETVAVLERYSAFWRVLPRASGSPPVVRQRLLAEYLVEPELSRALEAMAAQDAVGRIVYGTSRPRATVRRIVGGIADVVDCQNSSGSGVRDRTSGERVTVGTDHNPVLTRMARGADDKWRIRQVSYSGGFC